ncbi:spore coat associated protein CotJA [Clostridium mediterraneense]|uniref:spore coat associated protein CotJA n=1 Tax=Clostridium mediterraneense TaxID=1805472 RepID=UPI00082BFFF5|nr:spore coat associated protein CotJA [Clostridium mediterraneense]
MNPNDFYEMYEDDRKKMNKKEYARAYIRLQKFENLFKCVDGFYKGTIFKDLYQPYKSKEKREF